MSSGQFIVVFKDDVTSEEIDKAKADVKENGGVVLNDFRPLMNGFSAKLPEAYLASFQNLQEGKLDYIEPDGIVTTQ